MQILCDSPSIHKSLATQAELTRLITGYVERLSDYEGCELGQLVRFMVMARSDTVIELEAALGFSVRVNRFTGCRSAVLGGLRLTLSFSSPTGPITTSWPAMMLLIRNHFGGE